MKKFIVLAAVLAMVFAFSAQAMADVSLYGSARFMTYSANSDSDFKSNTLGYDDRDTQWTIGTLTRWGAKFSSGDVGGLWELDARQNSGTAWNRNASGGNGNGTSTLGDIRVRHMYGTWNFGSGQLLIGQTWPLTNFFTSHLNYTASGLQFYGGYGAVNARTPQIRLTFGNFAVGFLSPYTGSGTITGYTTDTDTTLPKIELRYDLPLDMVKLHFAGGWQKYTVVNATDQDQDVTAWTLGVEAQFNFGAAYVNANVHYDQNPGNYDLGPRASLTYSTAYLTGGNVEDITGYGGAIAVGFKASDMVTIEAGYGKLNYSGDMAGGDREDENQAYYAQVKLTMAPGVYIVPEFAVFDMEDSNAGGAGTLDTQEGKKTVFGIWWCINFK